MLPKLIHYSDTWNRALYIAIEGNQLHYLAIVKHPIGGHLCGYLNLSRTLWDNVCDRARTWNIITYEGIGSDILNVPAVILAKFPLEEEPWWIGFDYYQQPRPTEQEVLSRLLSLIHMVHRDWSSDAPVEVEDEMA
jgi:hypothetical protein